MTKARFYAPGQLLAYGDRRERELLEARQVVAVRRVGSQVLVHLPGDPSWQWPAPLFELEPWEAFKRRRERRKGAA